MIAMSVLPKPVTMTRNLTIRGDALIKQDNVPHPVLG